MVRHDGDSFEVLRLSLGGHQDEGPDDNRDGGEGRAQHATEKDEQHPGGGEEESHPPTGGGGKEGCLVHLRYENEKGQGSPIMVCRTTLARSFGDADCWSLEKICGTCRVSRMAPSIVLVLVLGVSKCE